MRIVLRISGNMSNQKRFENAFAFAVVLRKKPQERPSAIEWFNHPPSQPMNVHFWTVFHIWRSTRVINWFFCDRKANVLEAARKVRALRSTRTTKPASSRTYWRARLGVLWKSFRLSRIKCLGVQTLQRAIFVEGVGSRFCGVYEFGQAFQTRCWRNVNIKITDPDFRK